MTNKKNSTNERIKHSYLHHLRHAVGRSEQTIRQVEKSIARLENCTKQRDFKTFDQKQAVAFKDDLAKQSLAPATILSTLNDLKRFLSWLAGQPGYKRAIRTDDIDYLTLPEKTIRAASAPAEKAFPSLPMIEKTVAAMPFDTATEKRDRAMLAFTAISGVRDGALITLKMKHFDEKRILVIQDPKEVATKFSKRIDTFLFPLSDTFEQIFLDWYSHLRNVELFGPNDPLFPLTQLSHDEDHCYRVAGLSREHWANTGPARKVFKEAFRCANLPEFTPHRFRDMIVSEMYRRNLSIQEFKAWSQNLGHEGVMTTLTSYGKISLEEQGRLVRAKELISESDVKLQLKALIEAL